jgi:hypothetical protein
MKGHVGRRTAVTALTPLVALMAAPAVTAQAANKPAIRAVVIATDLNAPKHLKFGPGGLYVVESGTGGKAGKANCVTAPGTGGGPSTRYCVGLTGAFARITSSGAQSIARLPSVVEEDSGAASGGGDVSFAHRRVAVVFQDVLVKKDGSNGLPRPYGHYFGTLRIEGKKLAVANLARFAARHPQSRYSLGNLPGETDWDSDPYAVVAYRNGFAVADAAANSLLYVSTRGKIRMLARFPAKRETAPAGVLGQHKVTVEAQAVPTSVVVGPDGALYVGILRGVPSLPGTADIYRVVPGHAPQVWARGLTAVTAIAVDRRGRLLATELSRAGLLAPPSVPGALVRVSANGKVVRVLKVRGLYDPTGVAVGSRGTVYVSNFGASPGTSKTPGEVLRITGLG